MDSKIIDIKIVSEIARAAGKAIMEIYGEEFNVELKSDETPLTCADKASHEIIVEGLTRRYPSIPVLSEEGKDIPFSERRNWSRFWLVDPLDGTKEFIKRNGEFTVNIALVEEGRPTMGVIYVPALDRIYLGDRVTGARMSCGESELRSIRTRKPDEERGLVVVVSRSHPSPDLDAFLQKLPIAETVSVGSSLKLCAVAEGRADLYPRLGPTMEWDTAAGHAIVEAAGGSVRTLAGGPLLYNKESLLNPHFIVNA